jgi:hypothetical protein
MKVAHLQRKYRTEKPTLSVLSFYENKTYILELPYKDNKQSISCIPEGQYLCTWVLSPKFGWTYQVTNVPNRGNILIHSGNSAIDTHGCLLPGLSTDLDLHVWGSKPALSRIQSFFNRDNFKLIIKS